MICILGPYWCWVASSFICISLLFVQFVATPCKYFVFIKCLEPSHIPRCEWRSGPVEHCHASVCVLWVFDYCCFDSYYNKFVVCYSVNSWFSTDIICEISQTSTSTYSLFRLGESCVAHCILCKEVGGHIELILAFTVQDYPQWSCSLTSAPKFLPFISIWVVTHIMFNSALLQGFMHWTITEVLCCPLPDFFNIFFRSCPFQH